MKAITLWQPWASLIALNLKRYETRSWSTYYRGELLIHAAARPERDEEKEVIMEKLKGSKHYELVTQLFSNAELPLGCIVAVADLTKCLKMIDGWVETDPEAGQTIIQAKGEVELAVGEWKAGRFAWRLENVQPLSQPVPCKGGQRFWKPSNEVAEKVLLQL